MKIVVIGGTGLIGSKLVQKLGDRGHDAVAAAPNTGVDAITGEGLAEVLTGADVVVDVSNSPSFEDAAALTFFETSTRNLLAAETAARVRHHVALSVVGTEELAAGSGYFRAKLAQERLITASSVPSSIVHATQFFEFVTGIAAAATEGDTVRLAPVDIQPIAATDVAEALAITSTGPALNAITEIAGPERFRLDQLIRTALARRDDPRTVLADPAARYWGAELAEHTLAPGPDATLFGTRFEDWARETAAVN